MSGDPGASPTTLVPEGCDEREYARLLGYPWGRPLEGDVRARAVQAAHWYRDHGRPRVYTRDLDAMKIAVLSAGPEVEREVDRLWAADQVDEAYFLDRYAAAVVERLARELGPYRSPGCGTLPFEEQRTLFAHVAPLALDVEMLRSGMLKPRHSLLAVVPLGARGSGNPCTRCDLEACRFRRGPA
ncbi:MAG TPA: hypothetical protein VLD67_20675 [Vicinamibacterales bacterium]|nr:hypothetical protein [Vicinamibacterales bacterium]